jgi:circadian clock protein KaiC
MSVESRYFQRSSGQSLKSMLTRLVDFLKVQRITSMFTNLTFGKGTEERTEEGVSSLIDTWIVLRDVKRNGRSSRGLHIVKSRGCLIRANFGN